MEQELPKNAPKILRELDELERQEEELAEQEEEGREADPAKAEELDQKLNDLIKRTPDIPHFDPSKFSPMQKNHFRRIAESSLGMALNDEELDELLGEMKTDLDERVKTLKDPSRKQSKKSPEELQQEILRQLKGEIPKTGVRSLVFDSVFKGRKDKGGIQVR